MAKGFPAQETTHSVSKWTTEGGDKSSSQWKSVGAASSLSQDEEES